MILYLTEDYPYSKVHHELCRRIVQEGTMPLILYSVIRSGIKIRDLRPTYENVNYKTLFYELKRKELRYKFDFSYKINTKYNWLLAHCNLENVKIVHAATLFSEGAVALRLYKERGIPYIVTVRGTDISFYYRYMCHLWKLGLEILSNAKKVIFLTNNSRRILFNKRFLYGISSLLQTKIQVIPNGIDKYWIDHQCNKKKISIPSHLLYIGIFDRNKNVIRLLEVVLELKKSYPDLTLTLVGGGGAFHNKVLLYCKKYPETFCYVGKIYDKDKLCALIRSNDIFTMVSHSETFGLVYLEALSQCLPILYTKGQGIDGVFQEKIGEGVRSVSKKEIYDGLKKIIGNYTDYQTEHLDLYRFSWSAIAKSFINIYSQII